MAKQNLIFDFIANTKGMVKSINDGSASLTKMDTVLGKLGQRKGMVDGLSAAQQKLGKSAKWVDAYNKDLTNLNELYKKGGIATDVFEKKQRSLKKELQLTTAEMKRYQGQASNWERKIRQTGYDPDQMGNSGYASGFYRQGRMEKLQNLRNRKEMMGNFGRQALQSMPLYSAALGSTGGTLGGVAGGMIGGPVGAGVGTAVGFGAEATLGYGIKAAKDYGNLERVFNTLIAVAPEVKGRMKEIEQSTFDLGQSTIFSAMDVAVGYKELAKQGFSAQELLDSMPGLLNTAAAAELDLATSTDVVAGTLRGFNMKASETMKVADVLAKTAAVSSAGIPDLGEAMKQIAPIASIANQDLGEMASTLGLLANNMVKGSDAGTDIKAILLNLSSIATPSTKKQKKLNTELANMGVEFTTNTGKIRPFLDVMQDLGKATSKLSSSEKLKIFEDIAGKENVKTLALLANQSSDAIKAMRKETENSTGASKAMADEINKGMTQALGEASSALENTNLKMGKLFAPSVISGLQTVTALLGGLNTLVDGGITENDLRGRFLDEDPTVQTIGGFGGVVGYKEVLSSMPLNKKPWQPSYNPLTPLTNTLSARGNPSGISERKTLTPKKVSTTNNNVKIAINVAGDVSEKNIALIHKETAKAVAIALANKQRTANYDTAMA